MTCTSSVYSWDSMPRSRMAVGFCTPQGEISTLFRAFELPMPSLLWGLVLLGKRTSGGRNARENASQVSGGQKVLFKLMTRCPKLLPARLSVAPEFRLPLEVR
jgi:hypothetical protein